MKPGYCGFFDEAPTCQEYRSLRLDDDLVIYDDGRVAGGAWLSADLTIPLEGAR